MEPEQPISGFEDETSDWLWDLEDRYDLGAVDDPAATTQVNPADPRVASVKKHLRGRNGAAGAGAGTYVGMQTRPVAAVEGPRHVPVAPAPPDRHVNRLAIAAVVLLVLGLGGGGLYLATHRSGAKPSAISTPGGAQTPLGPPGAGVVTQPSTSDTTGITVPGTDTTVPGTPTVPPGTTTPAGTPPVLTTTGTTVPGRTAPPPVTGTPNPTNPPPTPAPTTAPTAPPTTKSTAPPPPTTAPTIPPATTVPRRPPPPPTTPQPTFTTLPH